MVRILIAENHTSLREALRKLLTRFQYQVDGASDGKEAVTLYLKNHYDLVLLDMIMPVQDGVETIFALRELDPNVRIVAMSGGGAKVEKSLCVDWARYLGIANVLQKPFTEKQLIEALKCSLN